MIRELDSIYFEDLRENFACMLDFAVNHIGYDLKKFYEEIFLKSKISNYFDTRLFPYLIGHSGIEYVFDMLDELGIKYKRKKKIELSISKSEEYWTGWVLCYYFFNRNFTLKEINDCIPIDKIRSMYNPYHEMDESHFKETLDMIYLKEYKTKLKRIREEKKMSQSELSEWSGVSTRTIQQYEQRQKDINKASFDTIYKFSKALDCTMEDLFEPIAE